MKFQEKKQFSKSPSNEMSCIMHLRQTKCPKSIFFLKCLYSTSLTSITSMILADNFVLKLFQLMHSMNHYVQV